ncbi:LPS O-antigen length regulator [Rheinheimera sp. YQF-2]|uniref:LPS O-antigen length regulator n=1 Tax=Rheinheimera lutimaris TaxID=2740584 RepID=A0A7Y5APP1_9GAMM|nr:Wzz/FepE/Etk N-terminal domain-containing protein [Rheinheimera lutimaris]NRQ42235.1 LPS O-antigen length regulator [Rheinheimera lutimaris]
MTENAQPRQPADDEIDLRELFTVIWRGKWIIIATTFVFAVASVFYALSLPNIYKSEALLAPAAEQKGGGLPGELGGLAALAGVTIGGAGEVDKTTLAIEIMQSREFVGRFIQKYDILVPLFAAKEWQADTNELIIDNTVFDVASQTWVRDVKPPLKSEPSMQEAHKVFMEVFSVTTEKTSGLVLVAVEHQSPYIAKQWVNALVQDINDEMRRRDMQEAQKSIAYLSKQINETSLSEIRTTLFSLIEEQTKTLMLASVRDEYAFQTIDPAIIPEMKFSPKRALIVAVATVLAGMLAVFGVLLISLFRKQS